MSQIQIKPAQEYKIAQILKELRKALPMDMWVFRKKFKEMTGCDFEYDAYTTPRTFDINDNSRIFIYDNEYNSVICNEETIELEFKNTIYIDDLKTGMIYLVHYDFGEEDD
jgi:hypothetical protein